MPPNAPGKKPLKYQSAYKRSASPLFLGMEDKGYWLKIRNTISTPIWLTEGGKKAGALLTRAISAISVSGVWNGQKKGLLLAELSLFAAPGRTFILAFDADWRTNINVRQALRQSANLLKEQGCIVAIASWKGGKGIDDYLVGGGKIEEVELTSFDDWVTSLVEDPSILSNNAELLGLDPGDEVGNTTFDAHCYKKLFGEGLGGWMTLDASFYRYENQGYWKRLDDEFVFNMISRYSMRAFKLKTVGEKPTASYPFGKAAQVKSAFEFCRNLLALSKKTLPDNKHWLCFQNGTVDIKTGELIAHDRNHYLTSAIASPYKPNEECPEVFLEFLSSAFGSDLIPVIWAVTSMLLDPTAPYGKFPYLVGLSGSGKGTLLSVWEEMIGMEHIRSSNDFTDLAKAESRHQNLSGVRFYSIPDIGGSIGKEAKPFYSLVDNETLSGRALFNSNGYQAKWNCRFAVASVEPLRIENSGDGWDRRAIPLPTKPRECAQDPTLKTRLAAEKAGIISWALSMPKEKRTYILHNLHEYERIEIARTEASITGNPIRYFVDACLRPSADSEAKMPTSKLHTYYQAFAQVFGFSPMGYSTFTSRLKTIVPDHYTHRRQLSYSETEERPTPWVPAYWANVEVLDAAFEQMTVEGDSAKCIKAKCKEGGLLSFSSFHTAKKSGFLAADNTEKMQNLSTEGVNEHYIPHEIEIPQPQNESRVLSLEPAPLNGSSDSSQPLTGSQANTTSNNVFLENAIVTDSQHCIFEEADSLLIESSNVAVNPVKSVDKGFFTLHTPVNNPVENLKPVKLSDELHTAHAKNAFSQKQNGENPDFDYEKMQFTTTDVTGNTTNVEPEFLEDVEPQKGGMTVEEFLAAEDESLNEA